MTNKLPFAVFLSIVVACWSLVAGQPQAAICIDCIDPNGTAIPTCTPTPIPQNPRRYVAGSNGLVETNSMGGYNWAPMVAAGNGYERIPMIRDWDDLTEQILSQLTPTDTVATLGGNSDWVMGPNEPDLAPPAGSDMTVGEVVAAQALIEALFPDTLIASPAYSQYSYQTIEAVYDRFVQVYGRAPRWDALAFHCYFIDTATTCTPVADWYVQKAQEWGISEVWCTEFAALVTTGSAGPNWAPAVASGSAFIDYMEAQGIDRYFWFSHCDEAMPFYICELANDDGTLTPLGEMYASK